MKRPGSLLSRLITPPGMNCFLTEGDGGGGGGGGESSGGDSGGGGGDANTAVLDFRAPDINIAADFMADKPGVDLAKATTPAKQVKKIDLGGKKPEPTPKPGEKPGQNGDPPVKQLRDELEAIKKERDELKAYREQGDPKVKEIEATLRAKETEIAEAKKRFEDYERRLAAADPEVTRKLTDLDATYAQEAAGFYNNVPELTREDVYKLVIEYNQLPFGKADYREARANFESKVNGILGGTEDFEHRKLERALTFIDHARTRALERSKLQHEVETSAIRLKREATIGSYTKKSESVKAALAAAAAIPEGIEKTDPYHPKLMIKTFMEAIPDEHKAIFEKDIPEFVTRVLAGPVPRGEQDYAGMTHQQVLESQAAEMEAGERDKVMAADVMFNGLRALRLFPILVKEWKRLREKLNEDIDNTPPDPSAGSAGEQKDGNDDIRNFKAPRIADINI